MSGAAHRTHQTPRAVHANAMIDLHCHILPGIDDGARDLETVAGDGARIRCRRRDRLWPAPRIFLPGLYHNSGPQIRHATAQLQQVLNERGIPLRLVDGRRQSRRPRISCQSFASGKLLSLADSRYVLVEPPHHVAPPRLEELFFSLITANYVPILTHPERLTWINSAYQSMERLNAAGRLVPGHRRLFGW